MSKKVQAGVFNRRALPFVGWRTNITRIRQLIGARKVQKIAYGNSGMSTLFPSFFQMQTKSGCNGSCSFCPQQKIREIFPEATMTDQLFESIITQLKQEQEFLYGVGFTLQNEPLCDALIFDRIDHFRQMVTGKAMSLMVTNGTLLSKSTADRLLRSKLDVLHVSVNGLAREDYEATNIGKSWDLLMENVEYLLRQDLSHLAVQLSFVRSSKFQEETARAIAYWRSRGISCFIHGINNRAGALDSYEEFQKPFEKEDFWTRLRKIFVKSRLKCCPYPFLQMSVLADGQVPLCTHDWMRKTTVGNLNERPIMEIWNGPVMRDIRLKLLAGKADTIDSCSDCDVFENVTFA